MELTATGEGINRAYIKFDTIGTNMINADGKQITVITMPDCREGLYVKFLDSASGQYRHWLFNRFYALDATASDKGGILSIPTNLRQPRVFTAGKELRKQYLLTADGIDGDMLKYLEGLIASPRVYVEINNIWVLCNIANGEMPMRWRKSNSGSFSITIELPEQNTISMI